MAMLWIMGGCVPSPAESGYWAGQEAKSSEAPDAWIAWEAEYLHHPVRMPAWVVALNDAPALPQLQEVQARINRLPFSSDLYLWGREDYWAQPEEFFARGGDCEDYALAKLAVLRALGWPEENLRLLLVQDMARGGMEHALLSVRLNGISYLLDSQTQGLLLAEQQRRYLPRYGMNAAGFWRY